MTAAGPIVKYVGGKTRLLPELRARLPKTYRRYYEPFVGGGALFFALAQPNSVIGDTNDALIRTYRTVASNVEGVIKRLEQHQREHTDPKYYYEVRDWWNECEYDTDAVGEAAAFLYMNKTCFNGLWRVNRNGKYNVPRGEYKNPNIVNAPSLRAASGLLIKARMIVGAYDKTVAEASEDDFVYLDPPYDPISKTSNFTGYSKDAFGKPQQEQLAVCARALRSRGVHVMLSNNDTLFVRSLYEDFCIDNVKCGRSINSKGDKRGDVNEVIITSFERTS